MANSTSRNTLLALDPLPTISFPALLTFVTDTLIPHRHKLRGCRVQRSSSPGTTRTPLRLRLVLILILILTLALALRLSTCLDLLDPTTSLSASPTSYIRSAPRYACSPTDIRLIRCVYALQALILLLAAASSAARSSAALPCTPWDC